MSNRALSAAFQHSKSKGSARLILLAMADEANDEGLLTAYRRSQSHLASKANIDPGTAGRAIKTLEELGEVEVLARGDGRASSDYRLHLPGLAGEGRQIEAPQIAPPGPAERGASPGETRAQAPQDATPIIPLLPGLDPGPPVDRAASFDYAAAFDRFWSLYPRKLGKPAARAAWERALGLGRGQKGRATTEQIEEGLAAWATYWRARAEPEFVPHAQTWLNQDRWNDAPPPVKGGAAPKGPRWTPGEDEERSDRERQSGRITDL